MNDMDNDTKLYASVDKLYSKDGLYGSRRLQTCNLDGVGSAGVYGEVTTPETIFRALSLNAKDHFIDLGSGRGQLVLAAATRTAGPIPVHSRGVELIDLRHEVAAEAKAQAPAEVQARCDVKCGDALKEDLTSVTKAFLCNTTFSACLNQSFARAFAIKVAPKLEQVATMMPFADSYAAEAGLVLTCVTAVKATYAPFGTALYIYSRPDAAGVSAEPVAIKEVVDAKAVETMLAARRQADRQALMNEGASGAAERGALRTALLQASFM